MRRVEERVGPRVEEGVAKAEVWAVARVAARVEVEREEGGGGWRRVA